MPFPRSSRASRSPSAGRFSAQRRPERACRRLGLDLAGLRCVVQGFGKVGGVAANELHERGAIVTAVSDVSGGLHDENGLDIPTLYEAAQQHGHASLAEHEGEHLTNQELLELPCDILVLAALEEQVTGENAPRVKARMIAEGANGPTTLEADAVFAERGVPVLPDILANAGGVTVSYFEWVQDLGRLFWDRDDIRSRLADKMGDAFDRVWTLAEARGLTLRQAALVTGIREVAAALNDRGLYP